VPSQSETSKKKGFFTEKIKYRLRTGFCALNFWEIFPKIVLAHTNQEPFHESHALESACFVSRRHAWRCRQRG
jgi:hypothetical protein